jgi:hypothetical protein
MAHYDCSCCGEYLGISHKYCSYCKSGKCHRAVKERLEKLTREELIAEILGDKK